GLPRVRGGQRRLTLARPGFNRLVLPLLLDRDRALELWLDPAGLLHHKLGEDRTGSNPKQVAFTPDGKERWVTLLGGHGVEVFDVPGLRRKRSIRLGEHGAVEVVFSRDGRTAYASQMETASVWVIDRRTYRVRRHLATRGVWSKVLALSADQRTLYVANWVSNDVSVIDLRSGRVRRLLPTVRTPRGLWPTPDGRRLYVAGFEDGELERIDLRRGQRKGLRGTGGGVCTPTTWPRARGSWSTWPASGCAGWRPPTRPPTPSTFPRTGGCCTSPTGGAPAPATARRGRNGARGR